MRLSYIFSVLLALTIALVATTYVAAQEPDPTSLPSVTPTPTPPLEATDEPITPLIVGGRPADPGEYPWMVALVNASAADPSDGQFCGGSLIDAEWVLTAAHCVFDWFGFMISPEDLEVVLGINNLSDGPTSGSSGQRIEVTQIIPHPDYDDVSGDSDVALLHLAAPASLAPSTVDTIGLVGTSDEALVAPGTVSTVTGWGATSEEDWAGSDALLEVEVPIVSNATCNAPSSYDGAVTTNMLCAGLNAGGKDSCWGDSGGPLIVPDGSGGWLQAGVVSWGYGCAQPNLYGVYARVSQFENWVDQQAAAPSLSADVYLPIVVTGASDGTIPTDCTPDSPGESDNIADALIVCSGQTVSGRVDDFDFDDVFKILVEPGQRLTISMNGSGDDADLYLYPPDATDVMTDIPYAASTSLGGSESIQVTIPAGGYWYVDVYSFSGSIDYDLTVSLSSP
jgi:secreted trypsin-like serine protease